jgi:hypothetical protein
MTIIPLIVYDIYRNSNAFKGKEITNKTTYIAAYNEILIGFGKNVK